ncbi:MAG: hypothetical protein J5922_01835, partial [Clostridia bacterium]|nr:hypothetical protein [Clostridia bacterium]
DKKLFDAIYYGVRSVLEKNSQRPTLTVTVPTPPKAVSSFVPISDKYSKEDAPKQIPIDLGIVGAAPKKDETALDLASLQNLADAMKVSAGDDIRPQPPKFSISYDDGEKYDVPKYEAKHVQSEIAEKKPDLQYVIVGELFNTYVICEFENKVVFVDKHAAHERIIFERLKNRIPIGDSYVKCLMLPITVNLSFDDVSALSEYGDFIRDAGFAFDISSNGDAANITEIPAYIDAKKANDVFITMLSDLSNGKKSISVSRNLIFERALYTVACKAAIKAGRIYQTEELRAICDELFANDAIRVCPHGRPVAYEMTKKDFDRQFGR